MSRCARSIVLGACAFLLSHGSLLPAVKAQSVADETSPANLVNSPMPDPAVIGVLGQSSSLDRPGAPPTAGAGIYFAMSPEGKWGTLVALEVTPRLLGPDFADNHEAYAHSAWRRMLANIALSAGALSRQRGEPDDELYLSLGVRLTLFDENDPLLRTRYRSRDRYIVASCNHARVDYADCVRTMGHTLSDAEFAEYRAPRWNGNSFAVSLANDWYNGPGTTAWTQDTLGVSAALAVGIGRWLQVSATAQYRYAALTHDPIWTGALRALVGGEAARATLEGAWDFTEPNDRTRHRGRLSAGAEFRVGGPWLSIALGGSFAADKDPGYVFGFLSLKAPYIRRPWW